MAERVLDQVLPRDAYLIAALREVLCVLVDLMPEPYEFVSRARQLNSGLVRLH